MKLKDYLAERLPEVNRDLLPSHAKLMGGVAFLRLRPELREYRFRIGELARRFYKVRAVYLIHGVKGVERRPVLELLAGEPIKEIIHREYGCVFKLDLVELMFCLGNSFERLRLAGLVGGGEVVVDMFAGVGQFTIPMAVLADPAKIYAIEINPKAYGYLLENIRLNDVEEKVCPILGDCREVVPKRLKDIADRVVMGYFWGTIEALPAALEALRPEGGIIHFHELARRGGEQEFVENVLEQAERLGYAIALLGWRKVKSYSKTRNHIVIDFLAVRR
ncbi:MAG: class I SAM-dependent methyltransferase family protein [Thaumarchaeota archaeon]|nr:class I SAM-dependent methyltransferase family protein [Nitrososphaerota archaeon]